MLEQIIGFLLSGFYFPGLAWNWVLIGIGISFLFGGFWLFTYWPTFLKRPRVYALIAGSALLTWLAIGFVQIPIQALIGQVLLSLFDQETLLRWLLVAGILQVLVSGLVQEGTKLVPVVIWWKRSGKKIEPKTGMIIGALSGAGFGIFEAVWAINSTFAAGWTPGMIQLGGILAILPFWERFFAVGLHIGLCALAGYGLAKGLGWQFYLLVSFLHGLTNYSVVLLQTRTFNTIQVEVYTALLALAVSGAALWLRWQTPVLPLTELNIDTDDENKIESSPDHAVSENPNKPEG